MALKILFRTVSPAFVAGLAAVATLACGEATTTDVPTTAVTSEGTESTLSASGLTSSDDATPPDGWPGPPEEALAACEGLAAEAACSFTSPRDGDEVAGTCRARRDDPSQLVCFPNDWEGRGPGGGHQGPPEEALAACEGVATGTACSFESPFGTVEGTCTQGPGEGDQVACRPDWADGERPFGPGHGGEREQEAKAACEGLQPDAACSFEAPFGTVSGNCLTGRDGSTLVCGSGDGPPWR